jgi:hypothetical protein
MKTILNWLQTFTLAFLTLLGLGIFVVLAVQLAEWAHEHYGTLGMTLVALAGLATLIATICQIDADNHRPDL